MFSDSVGHNLLLSFTHLVPTILHPIFCGVPQALSNVWLWVSVSVPVSYWKDDDWPRVKSMRIGECAWASFH